jgi:hypothetical protein
MRTLKLKTREEYLKKQAAKREGLQKKITEVSAKRQRHMDEEFKKYPRTDGEKTLDESLKGISREQAAAKGLELSIQK